MARVRALVADHAGLVGVVGAIAVLVGAGWYQALVTPPYRFIDEQAHVGYVLAIQRGQLPEIDTPIDGARGGEALRERLATEPPRRRDVWVANNPPLTYLVAAAPAAATRALGLPGGPLLGLRLVNLAAAAMAVGLSYLLARDLSGGDQAVGLVAAGLVAAVPHLGFVASLAFNDGMALLATTGVLWALTRVAGAGGVPGRRAVVELGLWCALAAATRPMALVVAVVAGALGFAVAMARRRASLGWTATWLVLPTLVGTGWFYALNVSRYGDPTGSEALFDKFGRTPTGSLGEILTTGGIWDTVARTVTTRRLAQPLPTDARWWYQAALVSIALALGGAVVVLGREVWARRSGRGDAVALPLTAWACVAVVAMVPVLLTAQHRSGGGASHPRYVLALVPVVAAAVALGVLWWVGRWAGLALVAAVTALTVHQSRLAATWLAENPTGPAGSELVRSTGTSLVRGAGLALTVAGVVVLAAAVLVAPRRQDPRRTQPAGYRGSGAPTTPPTPSGDADP
jgi:hypothetical protein